MEKVFDGDGLHLDVGVMTSWLVLRIKFKLLFEELTWFER